MNCKIAFLFILISFSAHSQIIFSHTYDLNSNDNYINKLSRIFALNYRALEYADEDTLRAFKCVDDAMLISKDISWQKGLAISNYIKAIIKLKYKIYGDALHYLIEAYKMFCEMDDNVGIIITTHYIGKLYYILGQTQQAKKILNNSMYLSFKNRNLIFLRKNIIVLANMEYNEDKHNDALDNLKKYVKGVDFVYNSDIENRIKILEEIYLDAEREEVIKHLTRDNFYKDILLKRNTTLLLLLIGIFVLILIIFYIIYLIYVTKEENKKLLIDEEISQAIIEKEKKFADIVRLLPQIIFETNKTRMFTFLNKYALSKLKFPESEIYLKSLNEIILYPNKKQVDLYDSDVVGLLNEKEFLLKTNDDKYIPVIIFIDKVFVYNNFYGFRGIMFDISERKTLEEKIFKAIIKTEEQERKRLSVELHDTLGPLLSTLKLYINEIQLENIEKKAKIDLFNNINSLLDDAVAYSREFSHNIAPGILKDFGLSKALKIFIDKINSLKKMEITFKSKTSSKRYNDFFEINIYRIVSELILNSIKHSKANNIVIDMSDAEGLFKLKYYDNGTGFNLSTHFTEGTGLINISSRVSALKGSYDVKTSEGEGFSFFLYCPLEHVY